MNRFIVPTLLLSILTLLLPLESQAGITVPFTYQGELTESGEPANGTYDFRFQVFSLNRGDSQSSQPEFVDNVSVVNGIFTVELDFNSRFESFSSLNLEIAVRPIGSGEYAVLSPRQPLHAALRSEYALNVRDGSIDDDALADNAVRAENVDFEEIQLRVNGQCPSSAIRVINDSGGVTCAEPSWALSGNAGTAPGTDFIGTSDDVAFDVRTNNERAMRYQWGFSGTGGPNLIGGHANNTIPADNESSVIAGGGVAAAPNSISASGAAIGGGIDNQITASWGTIPGGSGNRVDGSWGFAAGRGAQALHDNSFVWNDGGTFASTGPDQFLIDAGGGVGIGTNNPSDLLHISAPDNTDAMRIQIGGQTRFRVHDNGGVSIGVNANPPSDGLLVRGDIRYEQPRTRSLSISAAAFNPLNSGTQQNWNFRGNGALAINQFFGCTQGQGFIAPIQLPQDAIVREVHALVEDQDSGNNLIIRVRGINDADPGNGLVLAVLGTNGASAGYRTFSESSITNSVIDNDSTAYFVNLDAGCGGPFEFAKVRLVYEIQDLP
jgi:hypothetical protein